MMDQATLAEKAPVTQAALTHHVFVCTGTACGGNGSDAVLQEFWTVLAEKNLLYGKRGSWEGTVLVASCGSVGLCQVGPAVLVYPEGTWYYGVQPSDVVAIVEQHIMKGQLVGRLLACALAPNTLKT